MDQKSLYQILILCSAIAISACTKSDVKESLTACIADQYDQAGVINPPRDRIELGSTFRESDSLELKRGCFVGTVDRNVNVTAIKTCTVNYSNRASFAAEFAKFLGANISVQEHVEIKAEFSDFKQDQLSNISPSFKEHCLTDDFVPKEPIFASLLKAGKINLTFSSKDSSKIEITPALLKKWKIDASLSAGRVMKNGLELDGSNVFVAYKKVLPQVDEVIDIVDCSISKICQSNRTGYSINVNNIAHRNVALSIVHPTLRVRKKYSEGNPISEGDYRTILDRPNRRDVILVLNASAAKRSARLRLISIGFVAESGPKF